MGEAVSSGRRGWSACDMGENLALQRRPWAPRGGHGEATFLLGNCREGRRRLGSWGDRMTSIPREEGPDLV